MKIVQMRSQYRKQPTLAAASAKDVDQNELTQASGVGTKLPEGLQGKMEKSLGMNLNDVVIKSNSTSAEEINALAYTVGDSVNFAPGAYNPNTSEGQDLIGHEIVHVAQQRAGNVSADKNIGNGFGLNTQSNLEQEADQLSSKVVKGDPVTKFNDASNNRRTTAKTVQMKEANEWPNPFSAGQIIFRNIPNDMLEQIRVIPEDATGANDVEIPVNDVWYEADGLWRFGITNRWFKIGDHVELTVTFNPDTGEFGFNSFYNWVSSLFKFTSGWVPDAGDTEHVTDYPF